MKAGSMEGLIGANHNMKLVNTPMRVYREAEREGDTAKMERAMGYAGEFAKMAHEYKEQAQEELIKEQKEERQEQKVNRQEAIEKRKQEERLQESQAQQAADSGDTVEISEEAREAVKQQTDTEGATNVPVHTGVGIYSGEGKPVTTAPVSVSIVL